MKKLPQVTLVAMTSVDIDATIKALEYSCQGIEFGAVKLITDAKVEHDWIEICPIERINSIDEWNYNIIYRFSEYIDTDYALLIHADGFVVNPEKWSDDFLMFDYIGAPWPLPSDDFSYRDRDGEIIRVGNSVSLRSKRLLDLAHRLHMVWEPFHGFYNEDGFICVNRRHDYLKAGMKFAPLEVAKYFSHETMIPEVQGITPFVFHRYAGTNSNYPKFK